MHARRNCHQQNRSPTQTTFCHPPAFTELRGRCKSMSQRHALLPPRASANFGLFCVLGDTSTACIMLHSGEWIEDGKHYQQYAAWRHHKPGGTGSRGSCGWKLEGIECHHLTRPPCWSLASEGQQPTGHTPGCHPAAGGVGPASDGAAGICFRTSRISLT